MCWQGVLHCLVPGTKNLADCVENKKSMLLPVDCYFRARPLWALEPAKNRPANPESGKKRSEHPKPGATEALLQIRLVLSVKILHFTRKKLHTCLQ